MALTVKALEGLSKYPGRWMSERVSHGHGSLSFRALEGGEIAIYFRYQDAGHRRIIELGRFGADGARGKLSLVEARTKAGELARLHTEGVVALREFKEAEARKQTDALRAAKEGSFDQLMRSYCELLQAEHRVSVGEVTALFDRWVRTPFPQLLTLKAGEITHSDIMAILENIARVEKIRTLNKVRSYLLAAFNRAIRANGNALDAVRMGRANSRYGITSNPVASTVRVPGFDRVNVGRKLDSEEIRYIWYGLEDFPVEERYFFRINLRFCAQRVQQLLRVKGSDVDLSKCIVILWDRKGRRRTARKHELPIPPQAVAMLAELVERHGDGYLFSRNGTKPLDASLIGLIAKEISETQKRLDPSTQVFRPRDIRTTAESRLAEMGVSEEIRGRLLSHGLGGLQDTHYDQADYGPQLSKALGIWNGWLDSILADDLRVDNNVVPFRRRGSV